MNEETLENLLKKDPDLGIRYDPDDPGITIIESDLPDLDFLIEGELTPVDDDYGLTLFEKEENQVMMNVYVRIIQIIFLVNVVVAFTIILLGVVPYMLIINIPKNAGMYILIGLCVTSMIFYFLMAYFKSKPWIAIWVLLVALTLGAASAVIDDVAPLQAVTIIFAQSISMVVYTSISRRKIKVWLSIFLMIFAGICVWLIGIYSFVKQQDWISAGVILGLSFVFALYSGMEVFYSDNYSLSEEHMTNAIISFYCDPVYIVTCKKKKY